MNLYPFFIRRLTLPILACTLSVSVFAADFVQPPEKREQAPRKKVYKLKQVYQAPPPVDAKALQAFPQTGTPRNIIFIIGDGMGLGAQRYASLHAHGEVGKLVMEQMPVTGLALTYSANSDVTDSAASGTALSAGYKTNNGMIGVAPDHKKHRSIAEAAKASGRSVGIMTSDALTGATPAVFYAHVKSRRMTQDIATHTLLCKFDLLIGNDHRKPFLPESKKGSRTDGLDICSELEAKGYIECSDEQSLAKAPADRKVFGFASFPLRDTASLSRLAAQAFERLNANPKGFFIMVECSNPDWGGHRNNPDQTAGGVLMADFLVRRALDFAMKHKDTLVVVTADHETGGIFTAPNKKDPQNPQIYYGKTGHSGAPVGVFAFGPGSAFFNGIVNNIEIPRHFAELWNLKIGLDTEISE